MKDTMKDTMKDKFQSVMHTDVPYEDCHQLHDDIYLIKDKHYVYVCRHNDRQTNGWPKGFDRLATVTPKRLKEMVEFAKRLPSYSKVD